jgi:hypothetical protein
LRHERNAAEQIGRVAAVISKRRMPPASGSSKPATILKSVLLPQPLGPTTVTNSPGATLASKSASAVTTPKVLVTARNSSSGAGLAAASGDPAAMGIPLV